MSSAVFLRALRRHGLTLLLATLGAVGASFAWAHVPPSAADECSFGCWEEEDEAHRDETIREWDEEEWHEEYTNRTLKFEFKGAGEVKVDDADGELENSWCGSYALYGGCWLHIPVNHSVLLTPVPPPGTIFTGWEGACSGTAACELTMSEERKVTVNFLDQGPPLVPTITTPAKDAVVQQPPGSGVVVHFNHSGDAYTWQFLCRLNTSDYRVCTSPWTTRHLKAGPNTVRVKARDAAGNTSTPVTRRFTVVN